ncbi:MAG TPA: stage II sporulation protein P [Firmicutes bacterium]|jgi:stage II sporulation protein P|nr:stage II sporulation protein P [Bacillota bacterium]
MKICRLWLVCLSLVFLMGKAEAQIAEEWGERPDGGYYRIVDLDGRFITETAWDIGKGDLYIAEDNSRYIIDRFDGDTVYARYDGKEKMPDVTPKGGLAAFLEWAVSAVGGAKNKQNKNTVAIYHTHSAESYKPTSGTESKTPRGDIYEVGKALAEALEKEGYNVDYSQDVFLPHDGQAYVRSRRVAAEFAKARPQTILDVHRDAIPDPNSYRATVNGEQMSQIRLVVGKQNQNRDANLAYAKRIKAVADEEYPGLIKGIFHARGNYNQDIGPRTILLEFGTHTTTLEEAKKSAELMAKVLPIAAGMAPGTAEAAEKEIGSGAMRTFWWVLGIALVGIVGFALLNKEGLRGLLGAKVGGSLGSQGEAGEKQSTDEE